MSESGLLQLNPAEPTKRTDVVGHFLIHDFSLRAKEKQKTTSEV